MQVDLERYDELIQGIYDAALRPERWTGVVHQAASLLESPRSMLFTYAHSSAQGGFTFVRNMPQSLLETYARKMRDDPFVSAAARNGLMKAGQSVVGRDLVPPEKLHKTDFYRDVWMPHGIEHMCGGVIFDSEDNHTLPTALSFMRDSSDEPFNAGHANLTKRLLAHFGRAMGVMFHLRDSQWQAAASVAALNRLDSGVLLLNATRKIVFANDAANRLLTESDFIQAISGSALSPLELRLHDRLAQFEYGLKRLLKGALQPLSADVQRHFSQALVLPNQKGQPACVIHVAPLAGDNDFMTDATRCQVIVFVYDLCSAASVRPEMLMDLFDMTPAEAHAGLQVTQAGTAEQIAARLGVSVHTFKSHLKAAYRKSGTHRQSDFLKLLLALASR